MKKLILALWLTLFPTLAFAAAGTIYVNTGGTAGNSGTTDNATPVISGTAATWTTGANAITVDTNTNISTVPGCSAGTCDGSQAIYLTDATNTNQNIFWIASYTGCTGSGACVITTSGTAPTCTVCTVQAWAIGGQYIFPSGATNNVVSNALRAGDTIQFDNTPAGRTATYISASTSGSSSGFIHLIGKSGVLPVLAVTGNANVINIGQSDWYISNLQFTETGTSSVIGTNGNGIWFDGIKITAGGAGAIGISPAGNNHLTITNSEITGVGGAGISVPSGGLETFISGNYIHDLTGDCILTNTANPQVEIVGNLLKGCGGRGVFASGTTTFQGQTPRIYGNTIYGNSNSGIEATNANTSLMIRNNIIVSTNTGVATVKSAGGAAENVGQHGYNVFWNSVDSNSGLSGVTINATETAADPQFVAAGSGNFAIGNSSPAAGLGWPSAGTTFLSTSTAGYPDMGAFQRPVPASSGGGHIIGG